MNSETCLGCRHGDLGAAVKILGNARHAIGRRLDRPCATIRPHGFSGCRKFQAADVEAVKKRAEWIKAHRKRF